MRLGLAMLCLQGSIGAANDVHDAPVDRLHKPAKPIPRGLVDSRAAVGLILAGLAAGLLLSVPSGLPGVGLALAGVATGFAYDLRFKGTAWSWLPFAVGIPLLPAYAWVGAVGGAPPRLLVAMVLAVPAGAALAVSNALADADRDARGGTASVATRLGRRWAWRVDALLQLVVFGVGVGWLVIDGWPDAAAAGRLAIAGLAALVTAGGLRLGRSPSAQTRERGWELQAIGLALLALSWLGSIRS